jgi:hypothetical protein
MNTHDPGSLVRKITISMTRADLDLVGDRLSASNLQELLKTATEQTPGSYEVALTEARARDLASKAANLGLTAIANTIRHELDALAVLALPADS